MLNDKTMMYLITSNLFSFKGKNVKESHVCDVQRIAIINHL